MLQGIYAIKNKTNNKVYIGQSRNLESRFEGHKYDLNKNKHFNPHLQNAWNKYGEDNFEYQILEITDEEKLDEKEIYYISLYNSTNKDNGYNISLGGFGGGITEETKQKISDTLKGKMAGENHPFYGKQHFDETREKMSLYLKERMKDENTLLKMSNKAKERLQNPENHPFYGKTHSDKTKEKISQSRKGKCVGEENPYYGKKHSLDIRKKMRKLSDELVYQAIEKIHNGEKLSDISKELNIGYSLLKSLKAGKAYEDIIEQFKIRSGNI